MTNLFSSTAKFEEVVKNEEALMFHAVKFQAGAKGALAKKCFQYVQLREIKRLREK